jgi:ribosomal protein S6--L-glutamate ligase
MIIGVISRNPGLYSTQSIVIAGRKRRHRILVLDPFLCAQYISDGKHQIYYQDKILIPLDAIIPRIGATATEVGASLIDHFVSNGIYSTISSEALNKARNKWSCSQFLAQHGIPVPASCMHYSAEQNEFVLSRFQFPVIIKLLKSTQGLGVVKADTPAQALNILEAFQRLEETVIIQEFISEVKGSDIRVLIVNQKVEGCMRRQARKGEFRSNLHQGATAKPARLTREEEAIALKATELLKLEVAGVDILRSNRGPLILEVNASPGLEGIEQTMNKSISEKIIEMVEQKVLSI